MSEDLKNFDDSELDDIMKEIEELEQGEMAAEDSSVAEEAVSVEDDPSLDAVEEELAALNQISDVAQKPTDEELDAAVDKALESDSLAVEPADVKKTSLQEAIDSELAAVDNVVTMQQPVVEETVSAPVAESSGSAPVKMDFAVQGDMHMQIGFEISGERVQVHVTENGLEIDMNSGAKFSLPLKKAA